MAGSRGSSWRAAASKPLLILSLVFTATYALPIYFPDLPSWLKTTFEVTNWFIWIFFLVDFFVQLFGSESKADFLKKNWWMIVLAAVPFFRPVRAVATLMLAEQAGRRSRHRLTVSLPVMAIVIAAILTIVLGAATLDAERNFPGSNITSAQTAIWWAIGSVTSINAGDHYPISNLGHAIGDILGLVGLVLAGVFTASLGAWLVGQQELISAQQAQDVSVASGEGQVTPEAGTAAESTD